MRALVLVLAVAAVVTGSAGFEIDGRIPAGNIVVEAARSVTAIDFTATDDKGNAAVMVANTFVRAWNPTLAFGACKVVEVKVIDGDHTYATIELPAEMTTDSVWTVTLIEKDRGLKE